MANLNFLTVLVYSIMVYFMVFIVLLIKNSPPNVDKSYPNDTVIVCQVYDAELRGYRLKEIHEGDLDFPKQLVVDYLRTHDSCKVGNNYFTKMVTA